MRNLNRAQRIVLVIAFGIALWVLGDFLQVRGPTVGWVAYAPLASSVGPSSGRSVVDLLLWLALTAIWALASTVVLRTCKPEDQPLDRTPDTT